MWNLLNTTVGSEGSVKKPGNGAQGILTETKEKSHHSSLDSALLRHWSSQVSEVHTTVLRNFNLSHCRFSAQQHLKLYHVSNSRSVSCFQISTHIVAGLQLIHVFFQLSMSSTSHVSYVEVHIPIAAIRIDLGQGLRARVRQWDTEHLQTSFLYCLL